MKLVLFARTTADCGEAVHVVQPCGNTIQVLSQRSKRFVTMKQLETDFVGYSLLWGSDEVVVITRNWSRKVDDAIQFLRFLTLKKSDIFIYNKLYCNPRDE